VSELAKGAKKNKTYSFEIKLPKFYWRGATF